VSGFVVVVVVVVVLSCVDCFKRVTYILMFVLLYRLSV